MMTRALVFPWNGELSATLRDCDAAEIGEFVNLLRKTTQYSYNYKQTVILLTQSVDVNIWKTEIHQVFNKLPGYITGHHDLFTYS